MGYYRPIKVVGSASGRPGPAGESGSDGLDTGSVKTSLARISSSQTALWVGETAPANNPSGLPGWYFTNAVASQKILWNLWEQDVDAKTQFTFADLKSASLVLNNVGKLYPYFTVYTRRKNDGQDYNAGYRSRRSYKSTQDDSGLPKTRLLTTSADTQIYSNLPHTLATLDPDTAVGPQESDEVVKSISLSTSTGKNISDYNFTAQELILDTTNETFHIELDFDTSQDPNAARMFYQDSAPGALTRRDGDFWYDSVNGTLHVWTGSWTAL